MPGLSLKRHIIFGLICNIKSRDVLLPVNWLAKRICDGDIEVPPTHLTRIRTAHNERIFSMQDTEFGQWMWALDVSGITNALMLFNDIVQASAN